MWPLWAVATRAWKPRSTFAGICSHVTLLEFADHLLADEVLQEKAKSLDNVEIFTLSQTTAVLGDGQKVTGIRVKDRNTDAEREIELDGIFVQIGLAPNTQQFAEALELSPRHENRGRRHLPHLESGCLRRRRLHHGALQADYCGHGRRSQGSALGLRRSRAQQSLISLRA